MKRLLLIAALSMGLCSCYQPPGSGPAPSGKSAASRCFPELAAKYAEIDRGSKGQFKNHAEAFDGMKAKRHAALEHAFDETAAEFDAHFEKDDKGNLVWDSEKFDAALEDEAKGFEGK